MPLDLPAPDKTQLARSPLALVVCQVRFEEVLAVSDGRVLLAMHQALGGRQGPYPRADRSVDQGLSVQIGVGGASAAPLPAQTGWRLQSTDGRWAVALMPGYVSLETTAYTTWSDDFRPRLERLIAATAEHIAPALEQRLGLRYVDRITEPPVNSPQEWREYIAPELLGVILHDRLGPSATAAQQQVDLDLGSGERCSLRHGFFADPARDQALTYVLDFDVHREGAYAFDRDEIMTAADRFNAIALQLFQQSISPTMHTFLAEPRKVQR